MTGLAIRDRAGHVHLMDMQPAPAMNSRLVVMMTSADKAAIERRARSLDLTTSELVRRAAQSYDETVTLDQERMLDALADELEAAVIEMRENLQTANRRLEANLAEIAAIRAAPPPQINFDDATLAELSKVFGGASA